MLAAKLLSAAGEEDKVFSDDVFAAHTYTGNGATQTITNGIDLAGKGGLVWIKARNDTTPSHVLQDTVRSTGNTRLDTSTTLSQGAGALVSSFNANGFTHNGGDTGQTFVAWSFRRSPKFFDVVTYTGNGVARNIAHSLGVAPGMMIVKNTSNAYDWTVWHRSVAGPNTLVLNSSGAAAAYGDSFDSSVPTSTNIVIPDGGMAVNGSGESYVAYLFAHDPSAD